MTENASPSPGRAGATALSPIHLGIVLVVVGFSFASVADGISKLAGAGLGVVVVVWGRYAFSLLITLPPALVRHGMKALWPDQAGLQLLRGVIMTFSTTAFIWALYGMPLADALAIAFAYPFVVTALSPVILGEQVTARHWIAVCTGFLGVLVVIRPGFETVSYHNLLALAAGTSFALSLLLTRKLSATAPAMVTINFGVLSGTVILSAGLPFAWEPVSAYQWGLLALSGVFVAATHFAINRAYGLAPAATLAPIGYTEIVAAAAVGYLMFGDFPDAITWIGIAIITASGIYIALSKPTARAGKTATTL